jgi:uncharacterized protein YacL
MKRLTLIFKGQYLLKGALAVVFLPVGFALGGNLLSLGGLALLMFTLLFGVVGYWLPSILAKLGAQAWARLAEQLAVETARQVKLRLPPPPSWTRFKRPGAEPREIKFACPPLILDTSALIDGRIGEVIKTGFVHGEVIVPEFVLAELQRVADSSDRIHRERGRRGLDLLEEMKGRRGIKMVLREKGLPRGKGVDERLVKLARKLRGWVVTTDFNLNKVAKISGVKVLNLNELANALRPLVVPGETLSISVVQRGKEKGQGLGYLPDGTMIVIEDGEELVGQDVNVVVSRFLQTAAGRMIFAKPKF